MMAMMKNKFVVLFSLVVIVFISCQKEIDWGLGNGSTTQKLIRIKSKTGTDTTQIDYFYDAAKRIIREKTTGIVGGANLDNELIINRNSSGIITTSVQKAAALVAVGVDSVVTRHNYSTVTSRYTSSVFALAIPGTAITDSAVYNYDAGGRIISDAHYLQISGLPIPLPALLSLKNNYIYSASGVNIVTIQREAISTPGGSLSPVSSQDFTFDTKINPLIILNEAILLTRTGLYNGNNATKTILSNTIAPASNFTMDYTYQYNSSNKPDSSFGTRAPGGAITVSKYFYQ